MTTRDRQRVGVQSLRPCLAILEEVGAPPGRDRLADLSKQVGLHNSTTFHLAKTMVSLGYIRRRRTPSAIASADRSLSLAASSLPRSRW